MVNLSTQSRDLLNESSADGPAPAGGGRLERPPPDGRLTVPREAMVPLLLCLCCLLFPGHQLRGQQRRGQGSTHAP